MKNTPRNWALNVFMLVWERACVPWPRDGVTPCFHRSNQQISATAKPKVLQPISWVKLLLGVLCVAQSSRKPFVISIVWKERAKVNPKNHSIHPTQVSKQAAPKGISHFSSLIYLPQTYHGSDPSFLALCCPFFQPNFYLPKETPQGFKSKKNNFPHPSQIAAENYDNSIPNAYLSA